MNPNNLWGESCSKHSTLPSDVLDIPIKSILISHDPDRSDLDTKMLLRLVESIMYHASESQVFVSHQDSLDNGGMEVFGSQPENLMYSISNEILCKCYGEENLHDSTLGVLSLLGKYRWDAKLLLVLSTFATLYGEFWMIMQLKSQNSLAASIALLKQFPDSSDVYKPLFTALIPLIKTMLEVTRSVTQFEGLPITYVELQDDSITTTKQLIYVAAYWVVRSLIMCISLIIKFRATNDTKDEDPHSISSIVWEITSLKNKISRICTQLTAEVNICQRQTEQKMNEKLARMFGETHLDNQEVLLILFALKNDFPLKPPSEDEKVGISSLINKVVILLISNPELLPIEELFLLVQQTHDHPLHKQIAQSYDILWIPISSCDEWSQIEVSIFKLISSSLPWYSIRQPWSLSPITVKYMKEEWGFKDKAIMVALDSTGRISNVNAADMLWIWGAKAYPFSNSREKELWEEEKWSLKLLLDNIDPRLTLWVEEERTLCIYGSNRHDRVREFSAKIKDIQNIAQLEAVYVGKNGQNQLTSYIVSVIEKEKLSESLSITKIQLFWRRLESMRRSKLRVGQTTATDNILEEVEALLTSCENEDNEDWIIIGRGCSTNMVKLHGNECFRFLEESPTWKKYVPEIGLVDAIKVSLETSATKPCSHPKITSYNEGLLVETRLCEKCKHIMQKFIIYDAQ